MAYSPYGSFAGLLKKAQAQAQLRGTPLSAKNVKQMGSGYFADAAESANTDRQIGLAEASQTLAEKAFEAQTGQFGQTLAQDASQSAATLALGREGLTQNANQFEETNALGRESLAQNQNQFTQNLNLSNDQFAQTLAQQRATAEQQKKAADSANTMGWVNTAAQLGLGLGYAMTGKNDKNTPSVNSTPSLGERKYQAMEENRAREAEATRAAGIERAREAAPTAPSFDGTEPVAPTAPGAWDRVAPTAPGAFGLTVPTAPERTLTWNEYPSPGDSKEYFRKYEEWKNEYVPKQEALWNTYRTEADKYNEGLKNWNTEVSGYRTEAEKYNDALKAYNAEQDAYKGVLGKYNEDVTGYNAKLGEYNTKLDTYKGVLGDYNKEYANYFQPDQNLAPIAAPAASNNLGYLDYSGFAGSQDRLRVPGYLDNSEMFVPRSDLSPVDYNMGASPGYLDTPDYFNVNQNYNPIDYGSMNQFDSYGLGGDGGGYYGGYDFGGDYGGGGSFW